MTTDPPPAASRSRGPIARLDRATILDAGLQIARRPGTKNVTVRELGALLGADPTAIYRHFTNKDTLIQALLDELSKLAQARVTVPPTDWKEFLRQSSRSVFDVYIEHPSLGGEATRLSSRGPAELQVIEDILVAFRAAGLSGDELVQHYGALTGFIISVCAGVVRAREQDEVTLADYEPTLWLDRPLDVTAASHPEINENRAALLGLRTLDIYLNGVELILSSAEQAGLRAQQHRPAASGSTV